MMERRVFLTGVSAAVVTTAALSSYEALTDVSAPVDIPTRALFDGLLGSEFRIYDTDGRFIDNARLTNIEDGPCCSGLEQFSVVFESARTDALPERIFRVTKSNGQAMDVALTPVAGKSRHHRAVFNLLARA